MKSTVKMMAGKVQSFFKRGPKKITRDQRGQGMTEYALLLLVIVAIVTIFKDKINEAVTGKMSEVTEKIGSFQGDK